MERRVANAIGLAAFVALCLGSKIGTQTVATAVSFSAAAQMHAGLNAFQGHHLNSRSHMSLTALD